MVTSELTIIVPVESVEEGVDLSERYGTSSIICVVGGRSDEASRFAGKGKRKSGQILLDRRAIRKGERSK